MKKTVIALGVVLASLLAMNLLTPYIYKQVPSDYFRTGMILDSIREGNDFRPSIVFLGDSRGMSGVDGKQIEDSLDGERVYNLCTPSQTLVESALYYPILPTSVRTVVQCVAVQEFDGRTLVLKEPAFAAFAMSGYQLPEEIRELVGITVCKRFDAPTLQKNFECRTVLKSGISYTLLNCLDDDPPTKQMASLKYPYPYPSDRAATYERDVQVGAKYASYKIGNFVLDEKVREFLQKAEEYLEQRGIKYILLITPNHVDDKAYADYAQDIDAAFADFETMNNFLILEPEGFYDLLHPNKKGAKVLSACIADYLKRGKVCRTDSL